MRKRAMDASGRRLRRSRLVAALVGAGILAGVTSIAWAAIPDSGGVIHSCYLKSGGALRVLGDSVANCKAGETSLDWNQVAQATGDVTPIGPNLLGAFGSSTATCPNGAIVTGGGFTVAGAAVANLSRRSGNGWIAGAIVPPLPVGQVAAYAYCASLQ